MPWNCNRNFGVDPVSYGYLNNIELFALTPSFSGSRARLPVAAFAAILAPLAVPASGSASAILAPSAAFEAPRAPEAGPRSLSRPERATPAERHAVPQQYHERTPAVSHSIAHLIGNQKCCWIGRTISAKAAASGFDVKEPPRYHTVQAQYQRDRMLRIGAVLGIAYVIFVGIWFWTTRFRAR
jgi:hypothetical protein